MNAAIGSIGAILLALCTIRHAGAAETQYDACIKSTTSNPEWADCGQKEIDRQEAHLNEVWKRAFACFDTSTPTGKDARQSFLEEQRSWVKWKDSACSFYYPRGNQDDSFGFAGREGQVLDAPRCKIAIISDRTKWLEGFVKDCQ